MTLNFPLRLIISALQKLYGKFGKIYESHLKMIRRRRTSNFFTNFCQTLVFEQQFPWVKLGFYLKRNSLEALFSELSILEPFDFFNFFSFQNFDSLEHGAETAERANESIVDCVQGTLGDLYAAADQNDEAMQLCELLSSPHMRALQEAFDDINQRRFYPVIPLPPAQTVTEETAGTLGNYNCWVLEFWLLQLVQYM